MIFHLMVTMLLIDCATSADREASSESSVAVDEGTFTPTETSNAYVATTPEITAKQPTAYDR